MPKIPPETASDAYFAAHSGRSLASKTSFAQTLDNGGEWPNISTLLSASISHSEGLLQSHISVFDQWALELQEGFTVVLYGYGSKVDVISRFAKHCSSFGDVIVIDAYQPHFKPSNIIASLQENSASSSSVKRTTKESDITLEGSLNRYPLTSEYLYVLINSVDVPAFSKGQGRTILSELAIHPAVRLVVTVDKTRVSTIWSMGELSSRVDQQADSKDMPDELKLNAVWHDATTLRPYTRELQDRDLKNLPKFTGGKGKKGLPKDGDMVSETAINHILASVTDRAKKLFVLIGSKQLELVTPGEKNNPKRSALPYSTTFMAARDAFLAQSDNQMKSLLAEFTDHGVIMLEQDQGAGGEILWIAMSQDSLKSTLESLGQ